MIARDLHTVTLACAATGRDLLARRAHSTLAAWAGYASLDRPTVLRRADERQRIAVIKDVP